MAGQRVVTMITWERLKAAVAESPLYGKLVELLEAGTPSEKKDWPEDLVCYHQYRKQLYLVDEVIMYGERPLIPVSLRQEVLDTLHAAHHGVTYMMARASQTVFWPNITQDITATRLQCRECTIAAPSNPAPHPEEPVHPDYPFQSICMDFFTFEGHNYLAIVDRYSNWLSMFQLNKDDSAHVIACLRSYFVNWSVPSDITSDGASVFVSTECKDFYRKWGIRHRVSTAYYPRANKRSEVGVKSAKRLLMGNTGPKGSLNTMPSPGPCWHTGTAQTHCTTSLQR
jgi:hypothetical protein